jgi:hypothetical protein
LTDSTNQQPLLKKLTKHKSDLNKTPETELQPLGNLAGIKLVSQPTQTQPGQKTTENQLTPDIL